MNNDFTVVIGFIVGVLFGVIGTSVVFGIPIPELECYQPAIIDGKAECAVYVNKEVIK